MKYSTFMMPLHPPGRNIVETLKEDQDAIILIGPEGDFTLPEINFALAQGFTPVTLGESRLRTETAGVAAAVLMKL